MKKKNLIIWSSIILGSIIFAVSIVNLSVFTLFKILFIAIFLIMGTFGIGLFDKTKKSLYLNIAAVLLGILVFGFIGGAVSRDVKNAKTKSRAEDIIADIEGYIETKGEFPTSIGNITTHDTTGIKYELDTIDNFYKVSFNLFGWNTKEYDSRTREWYAD